MSASAARAPKRTLTRGVRRIILIAIVVVVFVVMILGTKIVPAGSTLGQGAAAFDPASYGEKQFPKIQSFVKKNAVEADTLATALASDSAAATKKYGVQGSSGSTEVPVSFTGVVGEVPAAGYTPITVTGLPAGTTINLQLGPAITGTDLRDANGKTQLGDFENQIQYQNAGSAINDELKKVLTKAGAPDLTGKTIEVDGVFSLVNPAVWNVTPATLSVQQ